MCALQQDQVIQIATMIIGLTITFERPFSSKTAGIILSTTWQIQADLMLRNIVDNDSNAIEFRLLDKKKNQLEVVGRQFLS